MMTLQDATIIGTSMSENAIEEYIGYLPNKYNKEFTELVHEICVHRGYFSKTAVKKIKLYRLPQSDYKRLTDGATVVLEILKTGKTWDPQIALMFLSLKDAQNTVNKNYAYGEMDKVTREKYIAEISQVVGDRLQKVDLTK